MTGIFGKWQPVYEEAGIATFPVDADTKKPRVRNFLKGRMPASRSWASKYADAAAFGFACGGRNGVTILDIDEPDEGLLADALARFGNSPVIAKTASEKFHVWYRSCGERRKIKSIIPGREVDLLGSNGMVIAPPSRNAKGQYRFIQGSLADLASLPTLNSLALPRREEMPTGSNSTPASPDLVPEGQRNSELWRACMMQARACSTIDSLVSYAFDLNRSGFASPLPEDEVRRVAASAWAKSQAGENWFGVGHRVELTHAEVDRLLPLGADATALFLILKRHHWGRDFVVANEMAKHMPDGIWNRKRFALTRSILLKAGEIVELRPPSGAAPGLYRFR